jgi:hypothetical protein
MKAFRTISSLALAFLVLMSSTSFMVGVHFCMGEVKSVALFAEADKCAKAEQKVPPCHKHQESDCCTDGVILHDGDDFKNAVPKYEFSESYQIVESNPLVEISEIIPASVVPIRFVVQYDPPLHSSDLNIDLSIFRI